MFEDFMPTAFVFAKGDDDWKRKRKASAHAFAKGRLANMMELMKDQLMVRVNQWLEEIRASSSGETTIDINSVFGEIITQNILTINFGHDISGTLVDLDVRVFSSTTDFVFQRQKTKIGPSIAEMVEQISQGSVFKHLNPFYQWAHRLTGIKNFTSFQRTVSENCNRINQVAKDIVLKRKSGEIKSCLPEGSDILSLFL